MTNSPMTGRHILAEFWQCQCDLELLTSAQSLLELLIKAVADAGLTLVGQAVHEFEPLEQTSHSGGYLNTAPNNAPNTAPSLQDSNNSQQVSGVTLTLLLAESHLCLHTWGEHQAVTLDIYVCNVTQDNSLKADILFDTCKQIFQPTTYHANPISRCH